MDEKTLGQVAYETRMKKFVTSSTWDNVSPEMQRVWEETAQAVVDAYQRRRMERLMRECYEAGGEVEHAIPCGLTQPAPPAHRAQYVDIDTEWGGSRFDDILRRIKEQLAQEAARVNAQYVMGKDGTRERKTSNGGTNSATGSDAMRNAERRIAEEMAQDGFDKWRNGETT